MSEPDNRMPSWSTFNLNALAIPGVFPIAQFEREMMLERQKDGIAKARLEGAYKGRKPLADDIVAKVKAMHADRRGASFIARELKIARASVYNILNAEA